MVLFQQFHLSQPSAVQPIVWQKSKTSQCQKGIQNREWQPIPSKKRIVNHYFQPLTFVNLVIINEFAFSYQTKWNFGDFLGWGL